MKKLIATILIVTFFICTGSVASANAGEKELLKKIVVNENLLEITSQFGPVNDYDNIYNTYEIKEVDMPYYVGKQKSSFLKGKEYDEVLYLGNPYYLPMLNEKAVYFSVSDEEIAVIEGNTLVGKKQGIVTVTAYNSKKKSIGDTVIAVTTYNDGKDVATARSFEIEEGDVWDWYNTKNINYWKQSVNTIQDMCAYLQARNFVYDFNKEPEFVNAGRWQWTQDAETIFAMSGGVCVQVAQMADYMLAENYEDWGNIIISGNQGHIFNWFYEDGYYYVFDFTQVISDNRDMGNGEKFRDYSEYVYKFKTIRQIKKWVTTEKVDTKQNFLICMYSCQGHDYMPAWYDEGCADTRAVLNGTNEETAFYGFHETVFDEMTVLYQNKKLNIALKSYKIEEMPYYLIYDGLYGYEVINNYYYDYAK